MPGIQTAGRLGPLLGTDKLPAETDHANALIVLNRTAFLDGLKLRTGEVLAWAATTDLGQDAHLATTVAARRSEAVARLCSGSQRDRRVELQPQWRLAVGLGNRANAHEVGLALHGTYGWPVIPGQALKGLTRAFARSSDDDDERRIFGSPPGEKDEDRKRCGTVRFLDALPDGPVKIQRDVLTPHVKPYYDLRPDGTPGAAPAEYHNPIPVEFLVVTEGTFVAHLIGPDADVELAAGWLRAAVDDMGAGGKTSAGYGYLQESTS